MFLWALAVILFAYLMGSINFAVIFSNLFLKKDVRKIGSGNAGATNVLRSAGVLPGVLTFVFDALKGFIASFSGKLVFEYLFSHSGNEIFTPIYGAYICGLVCMIGHIFPLFFGFKGGKGVATSVGIFSVCSPIAIILGLAVFAIITVTTKFVSLASVSATLVVVICSQIFRVSDAPILPPLVMTLIMGFIVIIKHKDNIKRLLNGTENKIGGKKKQ